MNDVLQLPTLVLNKGWAPIDSITVRDALCDVMSERARFLLTPDYETPVDETTVERFDIMDWMSLPVAPGERAIRSTHGLVKVPELMLLSNYGRIPVRQVVFCRRHLWRRDKKRCQYCGKEPTADEITIDHIVPKSSGGESIFENCVLCCLSCNLKKGNRSLRETGMRLRRLQRLANGEWKTIYYDRPKRPTWNPLYALRRRTFPKSWAAFLRNFDEALYWEVQLET